MNKSKLSMPAKARKKMNKEVRLAAAKPDTVTPTDTTKVKATLSRLPAKRKQKEEEALSSFVKGMKIKAAKKAGKHSKRTTPGTVDEQSPPQSVHIEGKRWIKSLAKQAKAKDKIMSRKMGKKGR